MSKKFGYSSTQTGEPLYQQFAAGKHIIPREGSTGGGNGRGFKGDPMGERAKRSPGVPFYEDSIVNKIITYNTDSLSRIRKKDILSRINFLNNNNIWWVFWSGWVGYFYYFVFFLVDFS